MLLGLLRLEPYLAADRLDSSVLELGDLSDFSLGHEDFGEGCHTQRSEAEQRDKVDLRLTGPLLLLPLHYYF